MHSAAHTIVPIIKWTKIQKEKEKEKLWFVYYVVKASGNCRHYNLITFIHNNTVE